jgi:hypothetical protein
MLPEHKQYKTERNAAEYSLSQNHNTGHLNCGRRMTPHDAGLDLAVLRWERLVTQLLHN